MTVSELLRKGTSLLEKYKIDNFANEARWIFESVFDCGREYLIFHADDEADSVKSVRYMDYIIRRANGEPVQYVIGSWDFYGETFFVGRGVLIPRPETEILVDYALDYLKDKKNPVIFDLCSGSGCIGLSVAKNIPDSKVYLFEKSDDAFDYLEKNLSSLGCKNATAVICDIFDGFEKHPLPAPDLILSNPPYIESGDIPSLQSEVLFEPAMALDGGNDGFDFYRAICDKWLASCNAAIAVECGEGQAETIEKMFSRYCGKTYSVTDFNEIKRVVVGSERK